MSVAGQDIFGTTMVGLEAGLQVQLIATPDLKWCGMDDDIGALLHDKTFEGFDHIPVRDGERIAGVVELPNCPPAGAVRQNMRPLDSSILVSGTLSLQIHACSNTQRIILQLRRSVPRLMTCLPPPSRLPSNLARTMRWPLPPNS